MSAPGWSWTTRGLFLGLVVAWGLNYPFVTLGLEAASPLWLALLRAAVGAAGTTALLLLYPGRGRLDAAGRRDALLLGIPNTGLFFGLWFVAARTVLPGTAAVLIYTFPLWVALLSVPVLSHRLTGLGWTAIAGGFIGVALISEVWSIASASLSPVSVAQLIGAAICWGAGTVLFQRRFGAEASLEGSAYGLIGGTIFLAALVGAFAPVPLPRFESADLWLPLAWMGVVGTTVAYSIWYFLLSRTRAATLSAYLFLVPVVALGASVAYFGEHLSIIQVGGVLLVLAAIYGVARGATAPAPHRRASEESSGNSP